MNMSVDSLSLLLFSYWRSLQCIVRFVIYLQPIIVSAEMLVVVKENALSVIRLQSLMASVWMPVK